MGIDWNSLRPLNGSQQDAFEELCCQLAYFEPVPAGAVFFRKGKGGDAGVEAYWRLPDNQEWGWQAKFFLSSPSNEQWNQINESVKSVLDGHPQLRRYTVCLPINLSDAREPKKKSAQQKWDDAVKRWQSLAAKKGMTVDFHYWGQFFLNDRLRNEKHRGRLWFWFRKDELSPQWFSNRLEEAIKSAGDRYSPDVNVELPIIRVFDALARDDRFWNDAAERIKELKKSLSYKSVNPDEQKVLHACRPQQETLDRMLEDLIPLCRRHFVYERGDHRKITDSIPWDQLTALVENALARANALDSAIYAEARLHAAKQNDSYGESRWRLRELRSQLRSLLEFSTQSGTVLANQPAMLLTGSAGQGKTHLLCDIAQRAVPLRPTILLHGRHFARSNPWPQLLDRLGLSCNPDEFVGALESAAQSAQCRALVFIDALNEGDGQWKDELPGMLAQFLRSKWIGVVVSVRTTYSDFIEELKQPPLTEVEHHGFEEFETEACLRYFGAYGIHVTTPPLAPEFSNPLFLKLLCRGLRDAGCTQVPTGLQGITKLFAFYLASARGRSNPVALG